MADNKRFTFKNPRYNDDRIVEGNLNEGDDDAENSSATENTGTKTEDQLRIEACKLSQKISKLMNNVSPADMLEIADACLKYIKYQKAGEDYDPTYGLEDAKNDKGDEKPADSDEDTEEESNEEETEEAAEDFELPEDEEDTSEGGGISFDDFDFADEGSDENSSEDEEKKDENGELDFDDFSI